MLKQTIKIVKYVMEKIKNDHISAFSSQAAFFVIIAFFPFAMFLLSIVRYFAISENDMLQFFTKIFPSGISSTIVSVITEVYSRRVSGTVVSVTAITTLWSAGKGFLSIIKGLNAVYEIKETRNYFILRIVAAIYTLVFALMLIITIILFVFGNQLYLWIQNKVPLLQETALVLISIRTIIGLAALIIFFLIIYIVIPNRKTKIMTELPGAIICAAGWMGFSYAFSFYIDNFSKYNSTYGSLTAIVLFMLWLYFCMYILFVGAELNLLFENKAFVRKLKSVYSQEFKD